MSTLSQIESESATLPADLRVEVLDFVQFLKQRHGKAPLPQAVGPASDSGDSPFFRALNDAGFVGCIETSEQLSSSYKGQLDFSNKLGIRP